MIFAGASLILMVIALFCLGQAIRFTPKDGGKAALPIRYRLKHGAVAVWPCGTVFVQEFGNWYVAYSPPRSEIGGV
jgi:hypothetical protein